MNPQTPLAEGIGLRLGIVGIKFYRFENGTKVFLRKLFAHDLLPYFLNYSGSFSRRSSI